MRSGSGSIKPRSAPGRAGTERPFVSAARASQPHSFPVRSPACGRPVTPIPFVMGATLRVAGPIHEAASLSPVCGRSHACPPGGPRGRERPLRSLACSGLLSSGSGELRAIRHDAVHRVSPEGDQQLAGQGDGELPPHPALRCPDASAVPTRQLTLRLIPQPTPGPFSSRPPGPS